MSGQIVSDSHNDEIESFKQRFRAFLSLIPKKLGYRQDNVRKIKLNVFKACFFALTGEGKYARELFETASNEELEAMRDYNWDLTQIEPRPFYSHGELRQFSHAKGQACARILHENEYLYRCEECFYDESCVLCEYCFNPSDHKGHGVMKYSSQGGGMCDCGDDSAFLVKLNCKCLQDPVEAKVSPEFREHVSHILEVALDFIIDVGNLSVLTLPAIDRFLLDNPSVEATNSVLSLSTLPNDKYGKGDEFDPNSDDWLLVLWKTDSFHLAVDLSAVASAASIKIDVARTAVNEVSTNGSAIITSGKVQELIKIKTELDKEDCTTTIHSIKDYLRENVVSSLLLWLQDVSCNDWNFGFKILTKNILAHHLLHIPEVQPENAVFQLHDTISSMSTHDGIPDHLLYQGALMEYSIKEGAETGLFNAKSHENYFKMEIKRAPLTRIQLLLTYELRFPTCIRSKLDKLIIQSLMHDNKFKDEFSVQFLDIFPGLLFLLAAADREVEDSCMQSISIQVFMCPPTNNQVVNGSQLPNIFCSVLHLLSNYISYKNESGFYNFQMDEITSRPDERIYNTIKIGKETIYRIFSKNDAENMLNVVLRPENLVCFMMFISLGQEMGSEKRETEEHVELERINEFQTLLKACIPLLNMIKDTSKSLELRIEDIKRAIPIILDLTQRKDNIYWCSTKAVTEKPASFMDPMCYFLGIVLRHAQIEETISLLREKQSEFSGVFDYSLQSIVLAAQVKIGIWVRNGIMLSCLASTYTGKIMATVAYYNDFHLMQIAALTMKPEDFLSRIITRWELNSWISDEVSHNDTVYKEKFAFACEQFIIFIYNILVERFFFDNHDMKAQQSYQRTKSLIYLLAEGPQPFSALWKHGESHGMTVDEFTSVLNEHADYSAPQGLTDSGVYRLKPQLYETVDPISLFLDSGSSQSTFMLLVETIAKNKKKKVSQICLQPRINPSKSEFVNQNLGNFLRVREFAKFTYRLLQVGLNEKDESILSPLLHLLHAILLDDEKVFGKEYFNQYFLEYPICNLLLSIVDALVSPSIGSKAELILEIFIEKDDNVIQSLTLCFGEMHIKNFTEKKRSSSEKKRKRSKDAAEARKAKILSKFAKQRQTFMKQNEIETEPNQSEEAKFKASCVACGEPESVGKKFGVPFALTNSSISWSLPHPNSPFFAFAFEDYWSDVNKKSQDPATTDKSTGSPHLHECGQDLRSIDTGGTENTEDTENASMESGAKEETLLEFLHFPQKNKKTVVLPFTCSHTIHEDCCTNDNQSQKFVCPLCDQQFSRILPTFYYLTESFLPLQWICGDTNKSKYSEFVSELSLAKNDAMLATVLHPDYFEHGKLKDPVSEPTFDPFRIRNPDVYSLFDDLRSISDLVANLIRSHEMASRVDGVDGMSSFVESFPSSAITLARSLIQSRVLLFDASVKKYSKMKLEESLMKHYSFGPASSTVFCDIVSLFFQTNESLQTLFRVGFAKVISDVLKTFLNDYDSLGLSNFPNISEELIDKFSEFEAQLFPEFTGDGFAFQEESKSFYYGLQKCVLPYLRHCVLFKHILTCKQTEINDYCALDDFDSIQDYEEDWLISDYISCLCSALKIPSLDQIIECCAIDMEKAQRTELEGNIILSLSEENVKSSEDIEYPNVQKLIDLPLTYAETRGIDQYAYCLTFLCLHCGEYLSAEQSPMHQKNCALMSIYYALRQNYFYLSFNGSKRSFDKQLPGPYLTEHGEVKLDTVPGVALLSKMRYKYLNKIWLNNELFGYISRSNYHDPSNPLGLNMSESEDEDDGFDDESLIWSQGFRG